jgi:hypothetical protein
MYVKRFYLFLLIYPMKIESTLIYPYTISLPDNLCEQRLLNLDSTYNTMGTKQTGIKCMQINLQHSKPATANLIKIVTEDEIDIIFIQEPYTIQDKVIGITTKYTTFTSGEGRARAAIVETNKEIDAMLIRQLTDTDTVAVKVIKRNTRIIAASMYLDKENQIEKDLIQMELVLQYAKNTGVLIVSDTNARSSLWYDRVTNIRGRILEEFITNKQLYVLNEESCDTTFSNRLGTSNIDVSIINPQLLSTITGWEISGQESLSDHRIIKYDIKPVSGGRLEVNPSPIRYRTNKESLEKFQETILQTLKKKFKLNHKSPPELDDSLSSLLTEGTNVENLVEDFNDAVKIACNKTFLIHRGSRHALPHKTVPWWTAELTVLRKRTNALRRLYQRTKNNEEHREMRKTQYFKSKSTYSATIKREKIRSWKEFCMFQQPPILGVLYTN